MFFISKLKVLFWWLDAKFYLFLKSSKCRNYTLISVLNLLSCFKVSVKFVIAVSALLRSLKMELIIFSSQTILGVEITEDLSNRHSFLFFEYSDGWVNFKNEYAFLEFEGWQYIIFSSKFSMFDSTVFNTYVNLDCSILLFTTQSSLL